MYGYGEKQKKAVMHIFVHFQSVNTWRDPVKLFRRRMQNYATLCNTIIQHYATLYNSRRYIAAYSPLYRRERLFFR